MKIVNSVRILKAAVEKRNSDIRGETYNWNRPFIANHRSKKESNDILTVLNERTKASSPDSTTFESYHGDMKDR